MCLDMPEFHKIHSSLTGIFLEFFPSLKQMGFSQVPLTPLGKGSDSYPLSWAYLVLTRTSEVSLMLLIPALSKLKQEDCWLTGGSVSLSYITSTRPAKGYVARTTTPYLKMTNEQTLLWGKQRMAGWYAPVVSVLERLKQDIWGILGYIAKLFQTTTNKTNLWSRELLLLFYK